MRYNLTIPNIAISSAFVAILLSGQAVFIAEPASAQTAPNQNCQAGPANGTASKAEPATPPDRTSADGTAPGNAGSTGWTGGTGGAHIGTNPQGATAQSTTWQPPTARGLDLAMELPATLPVPPC